MAVMRYYEDSDLLWAEFGSGPERNGKLVSDALIEHYNQNGDLFALSFINASDGVNIEALPESERTEARKYLQRVGLEEKVMA